MASPTPVRSLRHLRSRVTLPYALRGSVARRRRAPPAARQMRVLATGTEGYVGSLLAPLLRARGHDVVGVDAGFYADGQLFPPDVAAPTVRKDIRLLDARDFEGVDAVVHLAELSNDPLGQLLPNITYDVNHDGSV